MKGNSYPCQDNVDISACRVVIADNHPVVLLGLAQVLQQDESISVVGMAQTISGIFDLLANHGCDVLICDYAFDSDPQPDGIVLLSRLRKELPALKIILISAHHDLVTIKSILNLGVHGFVRKGANTDQITTAVHAVHANRRYTDPLTSEKLLDDMLSSRHAEHTPTNLSTREAETMRLLQKGMRVSEIAMMTHRSVKTVSAQKNALMRKLGVKSDMELFKILNN